MNIIGFVFCILAVLSFGAALSLEKHLSAHRLRSSYFGSLAARRQILNQTASDFYDSLKKAPVTEAKEKIEKAKEQKEPPPPPSINPCCARINLYPLTEGDPKKEPFLYETTAKLLKIFYGKSLFDNKVKAEYKFLDTLLKEVRSLVAQEKFSSLEKVSLKDPHFHILYYKMLKGTKKNDLIQGIGYPSLLDFIKIEPTSSKICLFHAHPNLLSVFFTTKGADRLYAALHTPKAPPVTQEVILRICQEVHAPLLSPEVFDLFEINRTSHSAISKDILIGEDSDTNILLRKVVAIPKSNK